VVRAVRKAGVDGYLLSRSPTTNSRATRRYSLAMVATFLATREIATLGSVSEKRGRAEMVGRGCTGHGKWTRVPETRLTRAIGTSTLPLSGR
jgi:hypothetical protein